MKIKLEKLGKFKVELYFTDHDIDKLWWAGCESHLYLQPDRYESDTAGLIEKLIKYEKKNNKDRSMLWIDGNHLDAMIVSKYYQEKYKADTHILWDTTDYGDYVVWINKSLHEDFFKWKKR